MTERDFCYWLQGFFEIENPTNITSEQVAMIKEHLQLVFNKVTGPNGLKLTNISWDKELGMFVEKLNKEENVHNRPYDISWQALKSPDVLGEDFVTVKKLGHL